MVLHSRLGRSALFITPSTKTKQKQIKPNTNSPIRRAASVGERTRSVAKNKQRDCSCRVRGAHEGLRCVTTLCTIDVIYPPAPACVWHDDVWRNFLKGKRTPSNARPQELGEKKSRRRKSSSSGRKERGKAPPLLYHTIFPHLMVL